MKSRTLARVVALQTLYELDMTDHPIGSTLENRAKENALEETQYEFALALVTGVRNNSAKLDQLITAHAPEWPLDQVAIVDRNILRMALWELGVYKKTPLKVGINEAVELAKTFGTDSSPRFVNGVLGSLAEILDKVAVKLT